MMCFLFFIDEIINYRKHVINVLETSTILDLDVKASQQTLG